MRRVTSWILIGIVLAACGGSPVASTTPAATGSPAPSPAAGPSPSPAGMSLDQEVGAVMMVGFRGPLTDQVLADWRQRQFGGLLMVNLNHNASSDAGITSLISQVRATTSRRVIAATDQEGGSVCLAATSVSCAPMPVGKTATTQMASALRNLGFDLDLGPVSDVCSGTSSIMSGRCYGSDPTAVAAAVGPVVDGIHAAGMLSAAKHFPGHGNTPVSSETSLPRIDESLQTLQTRDFPPFEAAAAHQTDFVLVGHLYYPAIDPQRSADLSPETFLLLRKYVGFRGPVLSDDMQMGAITSTTPTPQAAVQFLQAGGDMVMVAHDLPVADATYDAIKAAVESGRLPRQRLDEAVAALNSLPPN